MAIIWLSDDISTFWVIFGTLRCRSNFGGRLYHTTEILHLQLQDLSKWPATIIDSPSSTTKKHNNIMIKLKRMSVKPRPMASQKGKKGRRNQKLESNTLPISIIQIAHCVLHFLIYRASENPTPVETVNEEITY